MNTRSSLMVTLLQTTIASSVTSTAAGSAVDLANYFPVGKREVKCVLGVTLGTTTTGFTANLTLQQGDSTTTTTWNNVLTYTGSTVTITSGDGAHALTEFHGIITSRYVRALYNGGQATTGGPALTFVAMVFPIVRAA